MEAKIIKAPFSGEDIRILKIWQDNEYLHPFTCCDNENMEPTTEGMKCNKCGRLQDWVHDFMIKESAAKYNPFKDAKFKEKDNV